MGHKKSAPEPDQEARRTAGAPSEEEKRVWAALEQARKAVKCAVKKEIEAESVNQDVLNFRMKGRASGAGQAWS